MQPFASFFLFAILYVSTTADALSSSRHGKSLAPGRYRHFGRRLPVVESPPPEGRALVQANETLQLTAANVSSTVNASLIEDIADLTPHLSTWTALDPAWLKSKPDPSVAVDTPILDTFLPGNSSDIASNATLPSTNATIPSVDDVLYHINSSTSTVTTPNASVTSNSHAHSIPASSSSKQVYVHHMIGNTFPYKLQDWADNVQMAYEAGFDGFALNMGTDDWQAKSIDMAYAAEQGFSPDFKLFISFDMTIFPCTSSSDGAALLPLASKFVAHPNQATWKDTGRPLVSTFGGSECTFGGSDWGVGFDKVLKQPLLSATGKEMFFIPSVFSDPSTFQSVDVMDGELNWNGGWPEGQQEINFGRDQTYLAELGNKAYMASVSPAFFTHYAPDSWNKNWLYASDNFLFAKRWELLIQQRDRSDMTEIVTWNDYGESSHVGPIKGAQPNSEAWVDGLDHQPLLEINKYYATAFKTGSYPAIETSKIFLQARPHAAAAFASNDPCGSRPTGGQDGPTDGYLWVADKVFALIMASSPSTVVMTSGSASSSFDVPAGVSFLESKLLVGHGIEATLTPIAGNAAPIVLSPNFTFIDSPTAYNFTITSGLPHNSPPLCPPYSV